jgi:hypothetical protein
MRSFFQVPDAPLRLLTNAQIEPAALYPVMPVFSIE